MKYKPTNEPSTTKKHYNWNIDKSLIVHISYVMEPRPKGRIDYINIIKYDDEQIRNSTGDITPYIASKAEAYHNLGNYEEAIKCYDEGIRINPRFEEWWYKKSVIFGSLGNYEEAIKCCEKQIEINPNSVFSWYNKVNALDALGNYEEAIKCYDHAIGETYKLLTEYSDMWHMWYNRACSKIKNGDIESGIKDLEAARAREDWETVPLPNKQMKYKLETDEDLEIVRNDERFKELFK
jgi:tetratricopeptide (TPR) repeat protein